MLPRLITILVLVVAITGVSWGIRARAQSDTLEERVATLEAQVADLQARSLPAPDPSGRVGGIALINDTNSFEMACYVNPLAAGGNQYALQCMRFEGSAAVAQPSGQAPTQPSGPMGFKVTLYFVDGALNPVGGACVSLSNKADAAYVSVCDNDSYDLDPTNGTILTRINTLGVVQLTETKQPPGCRLLPTVVSLTAENDVYWQQLVHDCG